MNKQFGEVAQMNAGVDEMKELAAQDKSMVKAELSPDCALAVQPKLALLEKMVNVADSTPSLDLGKFATSMQDEIDASVEKKLADFKHELDAQRAADKKEIEAQFATVRRDLDNLSRSMRARLGVQVIMRRLALFISEELKISPPLDSLDGLTNAEELDGKRISKSSSRNSPSCA